MADTFATLIVAAQDAPLARQIAACFGSGGIGMWITPLSADGADPATHYITSGYVPPEFAYMVPLQVWEQGDPVAVYEAASANGVRIYAEDDGAGKTRLMALFATDAAVQIAIEP